MIFIKLTNKMPIIYAEVQMARIIENNRRIIKLSVDDIINIVREYQKICKNSCCYEHTRELLSKVNLYIPEEI